LGEKGVYPGYNGSNKKTITISNRVAMTDGLNGLFLAVFHDRAVNADERIPDY